MPGLQAVAWSEASHRLQTARLDGYLEVRGRNGLALFGAEDDPQRIASLRTIEDLFCTLLLEKAVPWGREGLSHIHDLLVQRAAIADALRVLARLKGARLGPRVTFRVIARVTGAQQPYRRLDLGRAVEHALELHTRKRWVAVQSGEDVEVWASLVDRTFVCGLRLTDASTRHRDYKREHLPASLRPSVAAAMVWLSQPTRSDVFLDPLCGAGTILIERALAERHALLLGGDADGHALEAARINIGPKHKPRQLFQWDAGQLPLASASVDRAATNLPFGKQMGTPEGNRRLYRLALAELARVLRPGGRAVLLAGADGLLDRIVRDTPGISATERHRLSILGQPAAIRVVDRRG